MYACMVVRYTYTPAILICNEPAIYLHAVDYSHKATWPGTAQTGEDGPGTPGGGRRGRLAAEVGWVVTTCNSEREGGKVWKKREDTGYHFYSVHCLYLICTLFLFSSSIMGYIQ